MPDRDCYYLIGVRISHGDHSGRPVTLNAYTATGAYIATATAIDDHPFTLSVTNIGIHSVITTVPVEYEAAALDDFTFTVPTASPTNALPNNLQAQRAIAVSWASESNRVYQVQWTPSLNTNLWGPLVSSVVGSGTTNTIFDIAEPGSRFYRVIVLR